MGHLLSFDNRTEGAQRITRSRLQGNYCRAQRAPGYRRQRFARMGHLLSFDNPTERAQWFTRARHQRQSRRTDRPRWRRRGGISSADCEHPPGRELDYGTQREQRVTGARHKGQSRPVQWTSRHHGQYIARVGDERKWLRERHEYELDYGTQREQRVTGARHQPQGRWTLRAHCSSSEWFQTLGSEHQFGHGVKDERWIAGARHQVGDSSVQFSMKKR